MYEIVAEVFIAVLAFVGTMAGSIMVSQQTTWRLDELERKVEKHNNVITRVYELEKHEAVMNEEIKVANHRIDDLEHFHK